MEMEPWDFGTLELELEDTAKKLNFPSLVKYFERKGGNKVGNPVGLVQVVRCGKATKIVRTNQELGHKLYL